MADHDELNKTKCYKVGGVCTPDTCFCRNNVPPAQPVAQMSGDVPQPYAGAITLLETIAQCGCEAFHADGSSTTNRNLCLRFASELHAISSHPSDAAQDLKIGQFYPNGEKPSRADTGIGKLMPGAATVPQVAQSVPVAWWNGLRAYDDRAGTYPSFSLYEDTYHDIPVHAWSNPCNDNSLAYKNALLRSVSSLAAAISLLERGTKKAAGSDKMFDQMLRDYKNTLHGARELLTTTANAGKDTK